MCGLLSVPGVQYVHVCLCGHVCMYELGVGYGMGSICIKKQKSRMSSILRNWGIHFTIL